MTTMVGRLGPKPTLVSLGGFAVVVAIVLGITSLASTFCGEALGQDALRQLRFVLLLFALGILVEAVIVGDRYEALRTRIAIAVVPALSVGLFALYKIRFGLQEQPYLDFVREDSVVEYATFAFLMMATVFASRSARLAWRHEMRIIAVLLGLLAAFTLLVELEEISYGQRIFGFETPPELAETNVQQEFNIHNDLRWGELTYIILPNLIMIYCLFGWAVLEGLRRAAPRLLGQIRGADLIFIPWYVAVFFIPLAIYRSLELGGYPVDTCCDPGQFLVWQDQEPAEMFFALGFALFTWDRLRSLRKRIRPAVGLAQDTKLTSPEPETDASPALT
jgi:hypothetical protein